MSMRESFEAARPGISKFIFYKDQYLCRSTPCDSAAVERVNEDWFMWQAAWEASRAAVMVELGKRWSNQDGDWFEDEDGDSLDYSETVRAIEAAGVQVKS